MILRWTAAGVLEADRNFRQVVGYRELSTLERCPGRTMPPLIAELIIESRRFKSLFDRYSIPTSIRPLPIVEATMS